MSLTQSSCSSPLNTTHSSRAFLVSGQQQQIFLPDFIPTFWDGGTAGGTGEDDACPIFNRLGKNRIKHLWLPVLSGGVL